MRMRLECGWITHHNRLIYSFAKIPANVNLALNEGLPLVSSRGLLVDVEGKEKGGSSWEHDELYSGGAWESALKGGTRAHDDVPLDVILA